MKETAIFGGGCFWCTEAVFQNLRGVVSVMSGYAGGNTENPTYEQVSMGNTGHAEVIKVEFDPEQIGFADLLEVFFALHDPTTLNRQGDDVGTQYRSAIFFTTPEQEREAKEYIESLKKSGVAAVTEVVPLGKLYEAEDYHQNYYKLNSAKPYCQVVISPKLAKLREKFGRLVK